VTAPWIVSFVALWVLVVVLALLVLGTLRRIAPLLERLESQHSGATADAAPRGLVRGTRVPDFEAVRADGGRFETSDLRGSESFVLFLSESCRACARFLRRLERDRVPDLSAELVVVVEDAALARRLDRAAGVTVLVQRDREIAGAFDSNVHPHAFVLDANGLVLGSGTPNDWARLERLREAAVEGGDTRVKLAAVLP
jgi:AhpC/TSA family